MKKILFLVVFISLAFSCSSDENIDYDAKNEAEIIAYLEEKKLTAQKSNSGLYYIINNEGSGSRPTITSDVTVTYKGYFLDGNTFDENSSGIEFNLQQLIKGFAEGVTYFKEGGDGVLLIPSRLAYGSNGSGIVPPNTVIVFDVKILEVN